MGQQRNKIIKRRRRAAYVERIKAKAAARSLKGPAKKKAAPKKRAEPKKVAEPAAVEATAAE